MDFLEPFEHFLNELDPLFKPIRQEERFQQLVRKMEAKYQAEH